MENNIKELRKKAGLSQKALAEKSGLAMITIQFYELNKLDLEKASFISVVSLADALNCKISDLFAKSLSKRVIERVE